MKKVECYEDELENPADRNMLAYKLAKLDADRKPERTCEEELLHLYRSLDKKSQQEFLNFCNEFFEKQKEESERDLTW